MNGFAYLFFIVGIFGVYLIRAMVLKYYEEARIEQQKINAESDQNMTVERLQEKYKDIAERNIMLLEEISRLRIENAYLSKQIHCSDLKSDSEFQKNLKDLIILSHPDKHGGHERAKRITQWLLELRR